MAYYVRVPGWCIIMIRSNMMKYIKDHGFENVVEKKQMIRLMQYGWNESMKQVIQRWYDDSYLYYAPAVWDFSSVITNIQIY